MYGSVGNDPIKKLITDDNLNSNLLKVQRTTSKRCNPHELATYLPPKKQQTEEEKEE